MQHASHKQDGEWGSPRLLGWACCQEETQELWEHVLRNKLYKLQIHRSREHSSVQNSQKERKLTSPVKYIN